MGPRGLGPKTIKLLKLFKSSKIMNISVFFEHGKDAHRDFEKGALNDSSRSLIWSFWEQIVFLEMCEKVSNVLKFSQLWVQLQYLGEK